MIVLRLEFFTVALVFAKINEKSLLLLTRIALFPIYDSLCRVRILMKA